MFKIMKSINGQKVVLDVEIVALTVMLLWVSDVCEDRNSVCPDLRCSGCLTWKRL